MAIDSNRPAPLTDAFLEAIDTLGLTDRELAALLRMSPTQLSRQKSNSEGHYLQVQRFDVLPAERRDEFAHALLRALARQLGVSIVTPGAHQKALADAMRAVAAAIDVLGQQSLPFSVEVRSA